MIYNRENLLAKRHYSESNKLNTNVKNASSTNTREKLKESRIFLLVCKGGVHLSLIII